MKLNYRIFASLEGSKPFEIQEVGDKKVEFFYLNDMPYFLNYTSRGRFYVWSSDGINYRIVVEKGFYENVDHLFKVEVNEIWITFLEEAGIVNKTLSKLYLIMGIIVFILLSTLGFFILFEKNTLSSMFLGLGGMLFLSFIKTFTVNKKINALNYEVQDKIREYLNEEKFSELVMQQNTYVRNYFKVEDEETEKETQELIEEEKNDEGEE